MSQIGNKVGKVAEQAAPILDQLMDKLTGRNASITYTFENFKIDMPKAQGPQGQQMMSGQISIRGSITISAELHKTDNGTTHNIGQGMQIDDNIRGNSGSISDSNNIPTTTMSTPTVGVNSSSSSGDTTGI